MEDAPTLDDAGNHLTDYNLALSLQNKLRAAHLSPKSPPPTPPHALILTSHPPLYTIGTATTSTSLPLNPTIPLIPTGRGGDVTYHGPGQLVAYPIIDLTHFKKDVHWYVRALEEVSLRAIDDFASTSTTPGASRPTRLPGLTGVFAATPPHLKVSSIGVSLRRWVTLHGVSLNVTPHSTAGPATAIVPCGIVDCQTGNVEAEFAGGGGVARMRTCWIQAFEAVFECDVRTPVALADVPAELDSVAVEELLNVRGLCQDEGAVHMYTFVKATGLFTLTSGCGNGNLPRYFPAVVSEEKL